MTKSFFTKARWLVTIILLILFAVPHAWGAATKQLELNLTSNATWQFPSGSSNKTTASNNYTNGITINLAGGGSGNGYYFNTDGYLMMGKSGCTLTFPAFSFTTTKIVVVGRSGASGAVKQNIYVGSTAVSTETTGATGTNTYNINSSYQAAGNVYKLQVTSAHNTQITSIEIWGESAPATPYTVTFTKTDGSTVDIEEASAGAGVTPPVMSTPCNGWAFQGWSEEESDDDESTDELELVTLTAGKYYPSADVTLYPVYTKTITGDPVETKTQTFQYDTWTKGGSTTDKSSYRLCHNGGYVESASTLDFSTLSKVIVYGGTYGGSSYNAISIRKADGTVWKNATVSGASQTGVNNITDGASLTGTAKLRVYSTCGSASTTGVRISKVEIYTMEGGSTTYYYSYPTCCTELGSINGSFSLTQSSGVLTATLPSASKNANATSYRFTLYNNSDVKITHTDVATGGGDVSTTFSSPNVTAGNTYKVSVTPLVSPQGTFCSTTGTESDKASITMHYTVTLAVNNAEYGSISSTSTLYVASGTSISASTNTLSVGATNITATYTPQTEEYTYGFTNWTWSPSGATITANTIATANFSRSTRTYNVTTTGITHATASPAIPATVAYGGSITTTITADANYTLPSAITVTGATLDNWNSSTGALSIIDVTGDVSITITAVTAMKRIYMNTGGTTSGKWGADSPKFFVHSWGSSDYDAELVAQPCASNVFYVDIPEANTTLLFTRQDPSKGSSIIYKGNDGNWGQSVDITISTNNYFTFNGNWDVSDGKSGFNAGTYTPDMKTIYLSFCAEWLENNPLFGLYDVTHSTWMSTFAEAGTGCYAGYYIAQVPSCATTVLIGRFKPGTPAPFGWSGENWWGQSVDFNIGSDTYDKITIEGWGTEGDANGKGYGSLGNFALTQYSISFAGGGGTGSMSSLTNKDCGSDVTLPNVSFTKTGYDFDGWHADVDVKVGGATIPAGSTIANQATIQDIRSNVALTAQWVAKEYTITLDREGASTGSVSVTMTYNSSSHTAITAPTKTGYNFGGWYSGDNGTGSQVMNASGELQANVDGYTGAGGVWTRTTTPTTLYAKWIAKEYTITLDREGASTGAESVTATYDAGTLSGWSAPSKTGYTFGGYWSGDNGTGTLVISTTGVLQNSVTISAVAWTDGSGHWVRDGGATVYAKWTANVYNITYKDQGNVAYSGNATAGVPTGAPTTHTYGSATALVNGTKTGYTFGGWYTDASCTVSAGSSIGATAKTSDFTLYAKWTATNYTLSYDLAGGSVASENPTSYTIESSAITLNNPTKAGYTFAGWTGTDLAEATTTVIIAAGSTGNRSYTATWTAKNDTYKTALHTSAAGWTTYASGVTKSGAGYTIPAPSSVAKGATSTCEDTHYHFAGWVADEYKGSPSGHIIAATGTTDATGTTYWAVWEKEAAGGGSLTKLTSSYVPTDGDNLVIVAKGTTVALYQETYSTTYASKWTFDNDVATVGADDKKYITLESDGGTDWYLGDETNGYLYTSSSNNLEVNTSGSKTAFTFGTEVVSDVTYFTFDCGRWLSYRSDLGTTYYRLGGSTTKASGASGNALFDLYKYVGVSYEDPKAVCEACVATPSISGVSLTGSAFSTTSVPVQATGASAGDNCSLASYGFYWGASADPSTNNTSSNNLSTGTFSATLTGPFVIGTTYHYRAYGTNEADNTGYSSDATFTLQNVQFNMHSHGGDAPATQVVPRGLKATAPSTPSETGYTFDGWWDNSSYTGSAWDFSTNTVGSGNVTLHAKWTEKPKYTVTLNAGNGTISDANWTNTSGSTYTRTQANGDEEITLPTPNCNCAGWVFQGWSTTSKDNAASFTPDKEDGASFVPAANVTYYAVYRANATGGTTYNKITSTGDLTTGNYIFMSSTGYAMKNVVTSSRMDEVGGYTASNSSQTIDNANLVWTIAKFNSQVVIKNGANYLGIDANNEICLTTTPHFFTYAYNAGSSRWEFTSATKTSYQLVYSSYFKILTSQSTAIYLFKQGAGLTGNYYTNPDCSDISVTGVVSPEGSGTVTLTAGSGKTGDKVYAMYTPDEDYNFDEWSISGTGSTLGSTTAVVTEITIGSANTTVTANFVAKDWKTITWKANGVALTGGDLGSASVKVENGFNITNLPPEPSSCDDTSTTFMGWVEESDVWSSKTNDVSGVTIYEDVSDFPTVTDDVTYHAVWARQNGSAAPATYAGTGVFTKITTLEELEVGAHYVLYGEKVADNTVNAAMNNTFSNPASGKYVFGGSSVTISDGKITNPATTIVWTLGGTTNAYTLYSQNSNKYVEITANDARAFSNPSSPTTSFTIEVEEGNFKIKSNHASASSRMISLYTTTEFRSYSPLSTDYVLFLYKYGSNYTYDQYLVKCCEETVYTFAGTGKSVVEGKTSFTVLREDLHGASSTTWAELEITYTSTSTGAITIVEGTGGDAGKTAWKLSSWGSRNESGGTAATTAHATFANPEAGKLLFRVKTATGATGQGTYRIGFEQAADATHCAATVWLWVDVTLRDKFVDQVNGNATINVDGHGSTTTAPTEASLDADKNDDCHETTRRLVGWVKETDMDSWYGTGQDRTRDLDDKTANITAPGATITTTGVTWYAIWGIEE